MESLYVCHFSNGHIKVGRSIDTDSRIAQHVDRVSCMGVSLVASYTVECAGVVLFAEAELIAKCTTHASQRHKNEWFVGLNFDEVCEWAEQFAAAKPPVWIATEIDEELPDFRLVLRFLKRHGYTQTELARLCRCSQPTISELSTGIIKEPCYSVGSALMRAYKVAQASQCRISDLVPTLLPA